MICDAVGHHPIDLFGHRQVARSDAAFYVSYIDLKFFGSDGASQSTGHVTDDDDEVGTVFHQVLFKSNHDRGCLLCLGAASSSEISIGLGDVELVKEVS